MTDDRDWDGLPLPTPQRAVNTNLTIDRVREMLAGTRDVQLTFPEQDARRGLFYSQQRMPRMEQGYGGDGTLRIHTEMEMPRVIQHIDFGSMDYSALEVRAAALMAENVSFAMQRADFSILTDGAMAEAMSQLDAEGQAALMDEYVEPVDEVDGEGLPARAVEETTGWEAIFGTVTDHEWADLTAAARACLRDRGIDVRLDLCSGDWFCYHNVEERRVICGQNAFVALGLLAETTYRADPTTTRDRFSRVNRKLDIE